MVKVNMAGNIILRPNDACSIFKYCIVGSSLVRPNDACNIVKH